MSFWKKALSILVSIIFLWLALHKVEWEKIPSILKTARPEFILLMGISISLEYLARGFRWKVILGKPDLPFFYALSSWIFGALGNNLFPARAGEFIRSIYLGRKKLVPTSEAFGAIVFERFMDGIVIVSFIAISFSMFPVNSALTHAGYSAAFFYFVILVFIVLMQVKKDWFDLILGFLIKPLPEAWGKKIQGAQNSFINGFGLIKRPTLLLTTIFLSYFTWSISVLSFWLSLQVFSIPLGFRASLLLISIVSIGAMIPSSPGMVGIYEYCFVLGLTGIIGIDHELSVTLGIFSHCFSFLYILTVGGFFLFFEKVSLTELQEREPSS